jgi:hypothetical protein
MTEQLNEGLRSEDLKNLIEDQINIDSYKSKMGEDKDVCVVTFTAKDRFPAVDLMEFIEKGYSFVLDSDVSSGENNKGEYFVFVEIQRTPRLHEQISELLYGVKRLTGIDDWQFNYHKNNKLREINEKNLKDTIPSTPAQYENYINEIKTEDIKNFFDKTLFDSIEYQNNVITFHRPFGQKISFELIEDSPTEKIFEQDSIKLSVDENSVSEIFWLTKIMGDYNINKIGDNFVFENGRRALILKRKEL